MHCDSNSRLNDVLMGDEGLDIIGALRSAYMSELDEPILLHKAFDAD